MKSLLFLALVLFQTTTHALTYRELDEAVWNIVVIGVSETTGIRKNQVKPDTIYATGACRTPTSLEAFYLAKPFAENLNSFLSEHELKTYDTIQVFQALFRYRGLDCFISAAEVAHGFIRLVIDDQKSVKDSISDI